MASDTDRKLVFLGDGDCISILDDNLGLIAIFTVTENGQIGGLFYSAVDKRLYAACKNDGFCIIDVSDPANPSKTGDNFAANEFVQISGVTVPLEINGLYVENQLAYLACGWAGVKIVNVADPANPSLIVHFTLKGAFGLTYALDLYASGDNLWVSDLYNGIHVFNIKDSELPEALYAISLPGAHDLTANNNYLYATSEGSGLKIYDISDPKNPLEAGAYLSGGLEKAVRVDEHFAYVAYAVDGLQIIDITDKSALFHDPSWTYTETDAKSIELFPDDDSIFITDALIGMQKLDVSDKSNIHQLVTYDTPADAFAIDVQGDYIYAIDEDAGNNPSNEGLRIIKISTENNGIQFFLNGFCSTPGRASDVYVSGDYAYVADTENGLQIIRISDKSNPVIIGAYDTPGLAEGIFVKENTAYIADGDQGLSIINISDKTDPQITGIYTTDSYVADVIVSDGYAYVSTGENGLEIINLIDQSNPERTGSCDTPGNAESVIIDGNYAYVADGNQGLAIINITDKFNPAIIASYNTNGYSRNISIFSNYAFIADGTEGIDVVDITTPEQPLKVDGWSYDTNGIAYDLYSGYFLNEELFAFVADGAEGVVALNVTYEDTGIINEGQSAGSGGGGCFVQATGR